MDHDHDEGCRLLRCMYGGHEAERGAHRENRDWGTMMADLGDGIHRRWEVGTMAVDRFETLLYGIGEAASYLYVPPTTLRNWVYGYPRQGGGGRDGAARPVVTAVQPERRNAPSMPFIGLAEGYALA